MRNKLALILIAVIGLGFGCKKSSNPNSNTASSDFFPPVIVSTSVDMTFAQYTALNQLQGYVYLTEGNRGIILYHTTDDQFVAFDRTCPYNTSMACAQVSIDSFPSRYRCGKPGPSAWQKCGCPSACCNSLFDATYGTVVSGEAKRGLKQYYTARQGNVIYVSSSPL